MNGGLKQAIAGWRANTVASKPDVGASQPQIALARPSIPVPELETLLVGESRSQPAASDQPAVAGPWSIAIHEVITGDAASEAVAAAHWSNASIRDGMQFVLVRLTATNQGSRAQIIQNGDFGITGDNALLYRFVDVQPPDPILHGSVNPGESLEGWIVSASAAGEGNLCLVFDSLTITGNWADAVIALDAGASIADVAGRVQEPNDAGRSIDAPAAVGETVATDEWVITIHSVIEGQAVYDLFPPEDYRTTALGDTFQAGLPFWIGLEVTITDNRTGGGPGFFPAGAFLPVDAADSVFIEALLLTPPDPTVVGGYHPGGSRSGWMLISMPVGYSLDLVRFRPSDIASEARYFTLSGVAGAAPVESKSFEIGDIVEVNQDQVNLREGPSTEAEIVTVLERGDRLVITGAAQEANGYTWYPVQVEGEDETGFVASHLIDSVD